MIPFVQYVLPRGLRKDTGIERPPHIEKMATDLIDEGFRFEIEVLTTGHIHMDCSHPEDDENPLASRVVPNGPEVQTAVDELVKDAYDRVFGKGEEG